jgi:cytochrome c1
LSGPEVYTAGKRLQEDYLISYMRNPQAWDPKIFMPNRHLTDTDLQKFVNYFHVLSEEVKP